MNVSLTKSDLCWVLIKGAGVLMLIRTLLYVIGFGLGGGFGGPLSAPATTLLISSAILIAVAIYLIKGGRLVHQILMSVPPEPSGSSIDATESKTNVRTSVAKDPEDPNTTLTATESKDFADWIKANSQYETRSLMDQIALFRDFQRDSSGES